MSNENGTSFWGGEYVSESLDLKIENQGNHIPLEKLVGVALRKNPKRAHLLVSKVLGKHYPQSPALIEAAAQVLAYQVHSWFLYDLNGRPNGGDSSTKVLMDELESKLDESGSESTFRFSDLELNTFYSDIAVFGYAETATSLGACIASKLGAYYVNSTRYPDAGAVAYGAFEEEHSHASFHHLTPKDQSVLNDVSKTILLVDDELTTGKTILNTISMLQGSAAHANYIVATLTDLRTAEAKAAMDAFAEANNVTIKVFSLFAGVLHLPSDAVEKAQPVIENILDVEAEQVHGSKRVAAVLNESYPVAALNPKNGVHGIYDFDEINFVAEKLAKRLSTTINGRTLVLGIEEDMFLPLRVASILEKDYRKDVLFSTTTRSPVVAFDSPKYPIRDRLKYTVPFVEGDTAKRFAYNIGSDFDSIVIVTDGAAATAKLSSTSSNLISALSNRTRNIFIMTASSNPHLLAEPLVGPEFGSYLPEDVKWLLKDLSNVSLESPTEEREEAIQSGGAHYAESLPIEYQPTDEYQTLFSDSLEESKNELASAIGNVSEQIYRKRHAAPVLVSLARAGTPIGVLIRRYLKAAYGVDSPHYAVSIVRGKGIDYNALNYIAAHHDPANVIFVDGWTGKGAIVKELRNALEEYERATGVHFDPELAVLADPGSCVTIYGTRQDYLIPSACLNSTVSGLVSRTVLNSELIGADDYHGAKFYSEFKEKDVSNAFVDAVSELFTEELIEASSILASQHIPEEADFAGWAAVERISEEYGINNVNLVKPGVGETTRVLLRRVPWKILVRPDKYDSLTHIILLAENRGVVVETVEGLPYAAVGLIHPKYSKGATGFDGATTS